MIIIFQASFFIKRPNNVFLLPFKYVKVGKHIEYIHQKFLFIKNIYCKVLSRDEVFTRLFFFASSQDEISSGQKCVNSKRNFTTGMISSLNSLSLILFAKFTKD